MELVTLITTLFLGSIYLLVGYALLFPFIMNVRTIAMKEKWGSKPFRLWFKAREREAINFFLIGVLILAVLIGSTGFVMWQLTYNIPDFFIVSDIIELFIVMLLFAGSVLSLFFYLFVTASIYKKI